MATAAPIETTPAPVIPPVMEAPPPKMVAVKLVRHYHPKKPFEVVGWHKAARMGKNAGGQPIVLEQGGFIKEIEDDPEHPDFGKIRPAPPPTPGAGSGVRLWASTVVRVPVEEAKAMRRAGIGEIEIDDD